MNMTYNEVNEIRDLSINEIDEVSGGDVCTNASTIQDIGSGFMIFGSATSFAFGIGGIPFSVGAGLWAFGTASSYYNHC